MQEKQNKRLLILFVILTSITILLFWYTRKDKTFEVNKDLFKVADLESIDSIILKSADGDVTLSFDGTRWKVNNLYDADRNMISVLFATLQQAEPKRPVSSSVKDSLKEEVVNNGVKVSLFRNNDLVNKFYAGGNTSKTQAYFLDKGKDEMYVMTIPGYRVYVSGILELGESGWRDKLVFPFNWRNFKSLQAHFAANPSEDFTVSMQQNFFGIEELPAADTAKLNTFLDNVSLLTVDSYANSEETLDSLQKITPVMALTIKDVADREYVLEIFAINAENQVPGIIQGNQLVYFDPRKIQPLLRPKTFFKKL